MYFNVPVQYPSLLGSRSCWPFGTSSPAAPRLSPNLQNHNFEVTRPLESIVHPCYCPLDEGPTPPAAAAASDTSRPPVSFLAHSVTFLPKSASPAFQAVVNRKASQLRNGTEWHNFRRKPCPQARQRPFLTRSGHATRTPAGSSGLPAQHHLEESLCGRIPVGVAALLRLR